METGGEVLLEASRITRIGKGVFETGQLDAERAAETRRVVIDFAERARELGAGRVVAVATEALRSAREGDQYLDGLRRAAGLDAARILSEGDAAQLTLAEGIAPVLGEVSYVAPLTEADFPVRNRFNLVG